MRDLGTLVFGCAVVLLLALMAQVPAQDAVPFLAAGRMWRNGEAGIYAEPDAPLLTGRYREVSCSLYTDEARCRDTLPPFVSPPLALPLGAVADATGVGVWVFRIAAAAALVAAVGRIGRRWWPLSILWILPAAPLLEKGQNTPLLLLAVTSVSVPGMAGLLLALGVAFKATPLLLLPALVLYRRWTDLIVFVATLGVLTGALALHPVPGASFGDWVAFGSMFARSAALHAWNVSADAWVPGAAAILGPLVALAWAVVLWRRPSFEDAWCIGWLAWPLLLPLCWWHYGWVTLGAVATLAGRHPDAARIPFLVWSLPFVLHGLFEPRWPWLGTAWFAAGAAFGTWAWSRGASRTTADPR